MQLNPNNTDATTSEVALEDLLQHLRGKEPLEMCRSQITKRLGLSLQLGGYRSCIDRVD